MMLILIIILLVLLLGGMPGLGLVNHSYGYYPSSILGVVLVIILILWLLGRV